MTSGPRDSTSVDPDAALLVVEDDERMARLLTAILTQVGPEIRVAGTAAAALDLLGEQEFRLITVDVGLPDLSGAELVVHIRLDVGAQHPQVAAPHRQRAHDCRAHAGGCFASSTWAIAVAKRDQLDASARSRLRPAEVSRYDFTRRPVSERPHSDSIHRFCSMRCNAG